VYLFLARKDTREYLICLLLQVEMLNYEETGCYKRIGLTKVPPYIKTDHEIVQKLTTEEATSVPFGNWHAGEGKHTIHLV
jgi:hypothetical protein